MQRKSRIAFGPGAASIILIVVILSMSVLGLLSWMNARNDMSLSNRSADMVTAVYTLNAKAEEQLGDLSDLTAQARAQAGEDAPFLEVLENLLPDAVTLSGDLLTWTEADELRNLECAVRIVTTGDVPKLVWETHRMTMRTEDTWDLGGTTWSFGSF